MPKVIVIPGDGIGPEITSATIQVLESTGVPFSWDFRKIGQPALQECGEVLPASVIDAIKDTGIALKGPVTTPIGSGFRSVTVGLRVSLGLYANVRHIRTWPGVPSRYRDVDIIVVRENVEDLYVGMERWVDNDTAESIKRISRKGSTDIAAFAFNYASAMSRRKVTAVHKANIMKLTDGLFLERAGHRGTRSCKSRSDDPLRRFDAGLSWRERRRSRRS